MWKRKAGNEKQHSLEQSQNRMLFAFVLNLLFAAFEVVGGTITGSVTILSDALHDFCDSVALLFAWRMEKCSKREADARYPFGYGRFSVIAGLVNCLILIVCSCFLFFNAIRLLFVERTVDGEGMLLFALFGILVNGAAMFVTARGRNVNEKTVSVHMLEDVLTWVAVLIVGAVMSFYRVPALDSLLSALIALVILISSARNLKKVLHILLMRSPMTEEEQNALCRLLQQGLTRGTIVGMRTFTMDGDSLEILVLVTFEACVPACEIDQMLMAMQDMLPLPETMHLSVEYTKRPTI